MKRTHLLLAFALTAVVLVGAGCQSSSSDPTSTSTSSASTSTQPSTNTRESASITMTSFVFSPIIVTVKNGGTVTFTNTDSIPHNPVADDDSFDAGMLAAGASKTVVMNTVGTIKYHCSIHPTMKGSIVVQ